MFWNAFHSNTQFILYLNIFWLDPDSKSELQKTFFTSQIQKIKDFTSAEL